MKCFNCGNTLVKMGKEIWKCPYASCELHKLPFNPKSSFWKRHEQNSYRHHLIEFTKAAITDPAMEPNHAVHLAKEVLKELGITEEEA